MAAEDVLEADAALEETEGVELPPEAERVRTLLVVSVRVAQGRIEEAREALERLEGADMPIRDHLWAVLKNMLGEHEAALAHARRYLSAVGNDADARLEEGIALAALDRDEEAIAAFRAGLEEDPESVDLLVEHAGALPAEKLGEFTKRFEALPYPAVMFETIVVELIDRGYRPAAEALIASLREIAPGDPNADYYEADLLATDGRHAEAAKILDGALERAPEEERWAYEDAYLTQMCLAGRALEGYHRLERSDDAFVQVADYLVDIGDGATLLTLVEDHGEISPDNPWVAYNRGRALALLGRRAEAEVAFAVAISRSEDEEEISRFQDARVANLYDAGEWRTAWEMVKPTVDTFTRLAWLFSEDENADGLAELVALHRKSGSDAEESWLDYWAAEILFLRAEYAKALAILEAKKEEIVGEDDLDALYQWEDRAFRCLLRLGKIEEARELALLIDERDDDPFYPAIVAAAAGDVEAAVAYLERCLDQGWTSEDVHWDPDLGPLLRAEGAGRYREVFPTPDDD
jgi:hypothetical protein